MDFLMGANVEADKTSIRRHFDRGAATYDAASDLQAELGRDLLAAAQTRLAGQPPRRIVELGCGTGTLTAALHDAWPAAQILAIDLSPQMLTRARARVAAPQVTWLEADAEAWLAAPPAEPIDLIIANATVQWFDDPVASMAAACGRLSSGGVLAVTTFGPQTFHELREAFARAAVATGRPVASPTLPFPDLAAWRHALTAQPDLDISCSERHLRHHYASLRAFLHHIRDLGATLPAGQSAGLRRDLLAAAEHAYPDRADDGSVPATWHCLRVIAQRVG